MKFDAFDLPPGVLKNLENMGFRRPTDIQYKAIRPILAGDDVLAVAQTGTGKTAAFGIPIVSILVARPRPKFNQRGVRCVIMEPTHELARQTAEVIGKICANSPLRVLAIHGGVEQDDQKDALEKGVDILIATPGRLFDLISQGAADVSGIELLTLDEADHMLDLGFIDDIRQLVRKVPRHRQTLFFSATIDEKIKKLAYSLVVNPIHIRISPKNMVSRNVSHSVLTVPMDDKRFYLERIARQNPDEQVIVFVRTRVRAERVSAAMNRVGVANVCMHGDKNQTERSEALKAFANKEVNMLIATDVTARGIDIPSVLYVVNYDVPDVPENYVHRVGRTGRGMQKGYAVTFCAPEEEDTLNEVEEYIGGKIDRLEMDQEDREATIDFSNELQCDWKTLIAEEIKREERMKVVHARRVLEKQRKREQKRKK